MNEHAINIAQAGQMKSEDLAVAGIDLPFSGTKDGSSVDARETSTLALVLSLLCWLGAAGFWLYALKITRTDGMTDIGLASVLTYHTWVALALVTIGFALAVSKCERLFWLGLLHLLSLVLILHLTPAIVYDTVRYSWTWKHIGIVDYIQRTGWVNPSIDTLPAYHNWPGFFLVSAWISNWLGIGSLSLANAARFASPCYTIAYVGALLLLYRQLTRDNRLLLSACFVFVTGNWIGQDYYSPQATAFLLFVLALALCIGPLRSHFDWSPLTKHRLLRVLSPVWRFLDGNEEAPPPSGGIRTLAALGLLVLIMAITAVHQLTPIALIMALSALFAIGRIHIGFALFALAAEVIWLFYFAAPFVSDHLAEELSVFGEGLIEASDRLVDTSVVTPGMYYVVLIGRIATLTIALLAVAGGLRRLWYGCKDPAIAVLAVAPAFLFLNSYGGEILFRVYLFALPALSFFAACAFFPVISRRSGVLSAIAFSLVGAVLVVGFVFANNGKDKQYSFSAEEVAASTWLYQTAPEGALLIEGARSYPSQFLNYEKFKYLPISNERRADRQKIMSDPVEVIASWLSDPKLPAGYVIFTRSQKAYTDAEGVMPVGALDKIENALALSPRFTLVLKNKDASIFKLDPIVGPMGRWAN